MFLWSININPPTLLAPRSLENSFPTRKLNAIEFVFTELFCAGELERSPRPIIEAKQALFGDGLRELSQQLPCFDKYDLMVVMVVVVTPTVPHHRKYRSQLCCVCVWHIRSSYVYIYVYKYPWDWKDGGNFNPLKIKIKKNECWYTHTQRWRYYVIR